MPAALVFQQNERIPNTRLKYIEERPPVKKRRKALFQCDCGNSVEADLHWVRFLDITSCGCYKAEQLVKKNTKHSNAVRGKQTGAYRSWQAMHQRCKSDPYYKSVSVCPRWSGDNGFDCFLSDMGQRPKYHSIERVDGTKDYEPGNCIWADRVTQAANTANAKTVTINGITHTIAEWCRQLSISYAVVKQRRKRGMSIESALTTPLNPSKQGRLKCQTK